MKLKRRVLRGTWRDDNPISEIKIRQSQVVAAAAVVVEVVMALESQRQGTLCEFNSLVV